MGKRNKLEFFQWIDGGSFEATRSQEYLDQLDYELGDNPSGTVDELRLDPIIDFYANKFFPWITVLMNEPKYFFLAPAIAEAIVQSLKERNAYTWPMDRVLREAKIELRYAEAQLCRALLADTPVNRRIIGIEKIQELKNLKKLERKHLVGNRGVASGINMHVVPRYLARTARLFNKEQEMSALELIAESAHSEKQEVEFWWHETPVAGVVTKYSQIIRSWLIGKSSLGTRETNKISIGLNKGEAKLLRQFLFGEKLKPKELTTFQLILNKNYKLLSDVKNSGQASSKTLIQLSTKAHGALKKDLIEASKVVKAVGIIRLAYQSILAGEQYKPNMTINYKKLGTITFSIKLKTATLSRYAEDALSFINECKAASIISNEKFFRILFEREKIIKGSRQKLCFREGMVTVKQKFRTKGEGLAQIPEPPFRLDNVRYAVGRISGVNNR